jgi:hypothetical protein
MAAGPCESLLKTPHRVSEKPGQRSAWRYQGGASPDEWFVTGSVVCDKRAGGRRVGGPVVPDARGHGQEPLGGAGEDSLAGAAAAASEVELALEGVVDRLDRLPDPAGRSVPRRLAAAAGAGRRSPDAAVARSSNSCPAIPCRRSGPARAAAHGHGGRARAARRRPCVPRSSDRPGTRPPASRPGGDQVPLQSPPPARMRRAVPVVRPSGQLRAPDGLPRGTGGGVDQPHRVGPRRALPGQPRCVACLWLEAAFTLWVVLQDAAGARRSGHCPAM